MPNIYSRFVTFIQNLFIKSALGLLRPESAIKLLLNLDNKLYQWISQYAVKHDNGLHPKHRLISYHDYFVKNINDNEHVLDIGCGNGALSYDIAQKTKGKVLGIDINNGNIDYANKHYDCDNLEFIFGDVLLGLPESNVKIDTVTMSNVIEHVEKRVEFMKKVLLKIKPKKILFRVPMYEREWMVPFKEELGVEYRLDQTHYIEYTQEDFFAELKKAGLEVESYEIRWGEIWAKALPVK